MDNVENEKLITVKENQMPPKKRVYATIENSAVDGYVYRVYTRVFNMADACVHASLDKDDRISIGI